MKNILAAILAFIALTFCSVTYSKVMIDQVPMYGGKDRNSIPKLKAADEKLINDTTAHFGSRYKASQAFIANGFHYYYKGDLENAMRRFNQAWLLDANNPEVYWGFGVVLHDKGQNCEAMNMMKKALSLDPPKNLGFYPDAGRMITLCAVDNQTLTEKERVASFQESEKLFIDAERFEPNKGYLYSTWATAYYWRKNYVKAWNMVKKSEENNGQLPQEFLNLLESKYSRPN